MAPEALRPGMQGVTYTVLQGSKIVPIRTEILGVAKNYVAPGLDLIIGKLEETEKGAGGAAHGMSGSPLFVDGKLVGALSRRIALFEKQGHCGFTPIGDMLSVVRRMETAEARPAPASTARPGVPIAGGAFGGPVQSGRALAAFWQGVPRALAQTWAAPLALPFSVSGIAPNMLESIVQRFLGGSAASGLWLAGGAAGGPVTGTEEALRPGAPVAAALMTGPISVAGTGTLTWRSGNQIAAFGHGMFDHGRVALPMATAEIVATIPSYAMPYKLANVGSIVGAMRQDRQSAVTGKIGALPEMATYEIRRTHNGSARSPLTGQWIDQPALAPLLTATALAGVLNSTDDFARAFSVRLRGTLRLKNCAEPLRLDGFFSGQEAEWTNVLFQSIGPVQQLYGQEFCEPHAASLQLDIQTQETQSVWQLERIETDRRQYDPGAAVLVTATLRERYGARLQRQWKIQLPESAKSGQFEVRVTSGSVLTDQERGREIPTARSLAELVAQLNRRRQEDRLYCQLTEAAPGQIVGGKPLPALPASIQAASQEASSATASSPMQETILFEGDAQIPGVTRGQQRATINLHSN